MTPPVRAVRDCLALRMFSEQELPLGNIAEDLRLKIPTLKLILKKMAPLAERGEMPEQLRESMVRKQTITAAIKALMREARPDVTVKNIQGALRLNHGF